MKLYSNEEINYKGCPGCAYSKHEFEIPCGIAYENKKFTLSQDWELPIPGFMIISPKRHVEKLSELTTDERNEMFEMANQVVMIMRKHNICDRFNYIFEEKENRHLHVWILPRYKWMEDIVEDIMENIGTIFEYAKNNFRTEEVYKKIEEITNIIKNSYIS